MLLETKKRMLKCYVLSNLPDSNEFWTNSSQLKKRFEVTDAVHQ